MPEVGGGEVHDAILQVGPSARWLGEKGGVAVAYPWDARFDSGAFHGEVLDPEWLFIDARQAFRFLLG